MYNKENNLIELERLAEDTVEDAVIYNKPYIYEMSCFLYSGRYLTLTSTLINLKKVYKTQMLLCFQITFKIFTNILLNIILFKNAL